MRLLLIEDNPVFARLMEVTLSSRQSSSFELATVGSLAAAKRHLGENQVDVVLCDLGLPDS